MTNSILKQEQYIREKMLVLNTANPLAEDVLILARHASERGDKQTLRKINAILKRKKELAREIVREVISECPKKIKFAIGKRRVKDIETVIKNYIDHKKPIFLILENYIKIKLNWNVKTARRFALACIERVLFKFEQIYPEEAKQIKDTVEILKQWTNGEITKRKARKDVRQLECLFDEMMGSDNHEEKIFAYEIVMTPINIFLCLFFYKEVDFSGDLSEMVIIASAVRDSVREFPLLVARRRNTREEIEENKAFADDFDRYIRLENLKLNSTLLGFLAGDPAK